MAEEGGCIDFYNYVYTPFSSVVHNTWGHIARYNLEVSNNPLHKFLKKPRLDDFFIDLYNVRLAAKYADKIVRKYDEVLSLDIRNPSAYSRLLKAFEDIENKYLRTKNIKSTSRTRSSTGKQYDAPLKKDR
jgi:hypothetical protein